MVVDAVSEMHEPVSLQQYCWPRKKVFIEIFCSLKLDPNVAVILPTRCRAKTQDSMAEESVCCRLDQNSSGLRIVERRLRAFVTAS